MVMTNAFRSLLHVASSAAASRESSLPTGVIVFVGLVLMPVCAALNPYLYAVSLMNERRRHRKQLELIQWLRSRGVAGRVKDDKLKSSSPQGAVAGDATQSDQKETSKHTTQEHPTTDFQQRIESSPMNEKLKERGEASTSSADRNEPMLTKPVVTVSPNMKPEDVLSCFQFWLTERIVTHNDIVRCLETVNGKHRKESRLA